MIGGAYAYVICMYACVLLLWILAHQFNSRVLASSNQGENVGISKLEAKIW